MEQDQPTRVGRRLAAIVAADVAGYSRLMHCDEEATHAKLTALLAEGVTPAIAEYGGRIVKNTGDGFLAEFPSAVEAVRAAVQFQTRVKELTTADATDARIAFRIGINVGDVIVEPHDIFGDGVNIAARLEGIAEPGGICISSSTYDQVRGKVGIEFADLGEQNLKNIDRPVRAYALVRDEPSLPTKGSSTTPSPPSAPRLSMVVLPFANLGGDPEQNYFVDGVTESLTTDLSRISGSFVIAHNTALTFKGSIDVTRITTTVATTAVFDAEGCRSAGGGVLGGQIGYRWQMNNFVFGLEAQGDWANLRNSHQSLFFTNGIVADTWTTKTNALGLFTGQVGYAWNNVLWYAKGGAAVANQNWTLFNGATGVGLFQADRTRWGGTVGTGIEYGFAPNWSVALEYDYLWRVSNTNTYAIPAGVLTARGLAGTVTAFNANTRSDVNMITARINYHFNAFGGGY